MALGMRRCYGVWLCQMDWICETVSCVVAWVHGASECGAQPSSDPASPAHLPPRGRLWRCRSTGHVINFEPRYPEPSPRGKVGRAKPGSDEGHSVVSCHYSKEETPHNFAPPIKSIRRSRTPPPGRPLPGVLLPSNP